MFHVPIITITTHSAPRSPSTTHRTHTPSPLSGHHLHLLFTRPATAATAALHRECTNYRAILVAPCFKNLLRLEAGYPALRCHILKQNTGHTHNTPFFKTINRSHAHNTHDKNKDKDDTEHSKTPKHTHTQDTLTLTQRRATAA